VISARPEPLPPRRSFMWRLPSALLLPKKKMYLPRRRLGIGDLGFVAPRFAVDFFAIVTPVGRKTGGQACFCPNTLGSPNRETASRKSMSNDRRARFRLLSGTTTRTSAKKRVIAG